MNDFTKEELESILSDIKIVRGYTNIEFWDEDLYDKIQSMIENYCEHENIAPIYGASSQCNKCWKIWG